MDETGLLATGLEKVSIFLILLVSGLGILAQVDAIKANSAHGTTVRPNHGFVLPTLSPDDLSVTMQVRALSATSKQALEMRVNCKLN